MRVVWKDSVTYKEYRYRKHTISKYNGGWITDMPDDNNIYFSIDCAHNAVDKALGGKTRKDASARHAKGIIVIGTRE